MIDMHVRLENYFRGLTGEDARISNLNRISGGWETVVYRFDLNGDGLILRMYPGVAGSQRAKKEFSVIKNLDVLRYPVPRVDYCEPDDGPLGLPFIVMQRIEGETVTEVFLRADPHAQAVYLTQFTGLIAWLHRLDWHLFLRPGHTPESFADPLFFAREVSGYFKREADSNGFETEFQPVFDWLQSRFESVPMTRPGVIHGDFHGGNIILTPDNRPFVIDWGNAMAGDTRYDLAWTLLLSSTFGSPHLHGAILRAYEDSISQPVDGLAFYEVIASTRRLIDVLITLTAGGEARGMRPDTAAMMRENASHIDAVLAVLRDRTGLPLNALGATIQRALTT